MTLEQLRIFVAVAECEHMTKAAESLGLTQSAVSAAIAALERRYNVALFHRVGRSIELSAEGRAFLQEARAVLERAQGAEQALEDMSGLKRGGVRLEASQTIASYWLPPLMASFRRKFPQIDLSLSVGNTLQAVRAVHAAEADLGFVEGRFDDPDLEAEIVGRDRLTIVAAPILRRASKGRLSEKEIYAAEWVLREPGSGTRSEFEAALRAQGIAPEKLKAALVLPSGEAMRAAIEGGAGLGAMSELAAAPGLTTGTLVRIPFDFPERPFFLLRHRSRYLSRAAEAFVKHCRDAAA